MAHRFQSLQGVVAIHPVIFGFGLGVLGTALWAGYKDWSSPNKNNQLLSFDSGFRAGMLYPQWSPFFIKKGWEALYNFNIDMLSKSLTNRVLLGFVERQEISKDLKVDAMGFSFQHPIGLGAGFARNGNEVEGCFDLGFSFVECGTTTLYSQNGNPPRRWWDIPPISLPRGIRERHQAELVLNDKAAQNSPAADDTPRYGAIGGFIHYMGNPNQGIRGVASQLKLFHQKKAKCSDRIVGVNLALSDSISPLQDPQRYDDFLTMYNIIAPYTHYIVINVKENEAFSFYENFPTQPTPEQLAYMDPEEWENPSMYLNELAKDGITAEDLEQVGLSLPQSIYQLPRGAQHFTMNPNYTQFAEKLLQTRDNGRLYPDLYSNVNDFHHQDYRMNVYYHQKLQSLDQEHSLAEKGLADLFRTTLDGSYPSELTHNQNLQDLGSGFSSYTTRLDVLNERLSLIETERSKIRAIIADIDSNTTKLRIDHLKSFPTSKSLEEQNEKDLQQQSEQDRYELAKALLEQQFDETDPQLISQLELLEPSNPNKLQSYYQEETIQGYHVYDRSKLNTLGGHASQLSALDLSRSLQRVQKRTNKPRILFKLNSDMEPRLAILFSKWALLHGVDGIIVGNSSSNRMGVLQPDFFPAHKQIDDEVMERPSMGEEDYNATTTRLEPTLEDSAAMQYQFHHTSPDHPLQLPNISQPGYISGPAIRDPSTRLIATVYHHTEGKLPIIGSGGIATAQDAYEKILAGASLLQINSALHHDITIVPKLRNGLNQLIQQDLAEYRANFQGESCLDESQRLMFEQLLQGNVLNNSKKDEESNPMLQSEFDMGALSVKDLNSLRDEYKSLWKINHIVGKTSSTIAALVSDPYVECYNDLNFVREEYKRRINSSKPQQNQQTQQTQFAETDQTSLPSSPLPQDSLVETDQTSLSPPPLLQNCPAETQQTSFPSSLPQIHLDDPTFLPTAFASISTQPSTPLQQPTAVVDEHPKQSVGGIWYWLGY